MALEQRFSANRSSDGLSIIITDLTGAYDATTNKGGYGGVNPSVSDFTALTLSCFLTDSITAYPQSSAVNITAIFPTLPSEVNGTYTIPSADLLGATGVFTDGVYKFVMNGTYDIGAGDVAITAVTFYKVFYYIGECCWQQNRLETPLCNNKEKNEKLSRAGAILMLLSPYINSEDEVTESYIESCEAWDTGAEYVLYLREVCELFSCDGGGCQPCH